MEDAPYEGYIWDAVTDSEVQRVEIEDYASLWVRFPLLAHRSSFLSRSTGTFVWTLNETN
jgi:hypothetical protein